ncbi:nitroreductase family protein [Parabacteroides sp. PF5-9]|uniref:nitroreductase family protein n=1 Tax=Parabacteroides sp. PF5-9 TaxID=1742404 RepID=UPI002475DD4B|nr:nitroreductase family protein [Parabacteroides sp. PF5-9]MDH6357867.1 putative oxidoreductase (fatty acid repression mutant protein) [Parabacteroides sp. PF5-9]
MKTYLKDAIINRRTNYKLSPQSPISDDEIQEIIRFAVKHIPSAFNSQSTRIVLLLGEQHRKLWELTKSVLKGNKTDEQFASTKNKIDNAFASGYGTVLFYEDGQVIEALQEAFPTYKEKFPEWSHHTSAMHQFALWTILTDVGFGASLQHYNPLIDASVAQTWSIEPHWRLVAQMPFGLPTQHPGEKEFKPVDERIRVFK